jgi:TolB-like protein/Tfp pilus assembly protein PilF
VSLFAELQRRSVFKVAAAYLVVGWLVVQAASIAFPLFEAPTWALRVFVFVVALGFPLALVIAWAVELTPEGLKLDAAPTGNKRFFAATGALAMLAFAWFYLGQGASSGGAGGEGAIADARSIAVLPFVNMSGDAENEYFSDGISEEILNSLAQMPDVKVAARTSSFSFKGHTKEIPDIARELEVRMVLEGSVRKQGERVRITAQLIDASKGFHVWSQTYDRELKDIFAIQDEIAHAIADELQVKLTAAHDDGKADTADLVAYDEYLKGMQLWQAREEANLREAERLFRSALERDPGYSKALAGKALTWLVLPEWTQEPLAPSWAIARDAAEHASALDPSLPEPYAVLGYIALAEDRLDTGRALFARAHALAPSYATAWQWQGEGLLYAGDFDGAVEATRRATKLDPKSAVVRQAHANALFFAGRDAEALAVCEAVLQDFPHWFNCALMKYDAALDRKDFASARALLREMAASRGPEGVRFAEQMSDALEGKGDRRAVARRLATLMDGTLDPAAISPLADGDALFYGIAVGEPVLMLPRARAIQGRLPYNLRALMQDVHFGPLHCLPEYAPLIAELKIDAAKSAAFCERSKQPRRAPPMAPPKKS